jgi:hypothetical protein
MEPLPLRDIHLPEPVGGWPPAIGWWLLLLGLVAITALVAWRIRRGRRMTPVRRALRELEALRADPALSPNEKLRRLSILLRRIALTLYPRQEIAGLTGDAWLRWLDTILGQPRFSQGPGRRLAEAPYRPAAPAEAEELLALGRDWLLALSKTRLGRGAPPRR